MTLHRIEFLYYLSKRARIRVYPYLSGHRHGDGGMCAVVVQGEMLEADLVNVADVGANGECGEGQRLTRALETKRIHVGSIDVGVAHDMDEVAGTEMADVGEETGEEGVAGDVERDTEPEIGGALVELTGEFAVVDVELAEHVAGRQGHLVEIDGVPGGQDDPAIGGVGLDLADDIAELVDALARVVVVHGAIGGAEMSPLESVDGSEITFFAMCQSAGIQKLAGSIGVPDMDVFVAEGLDVGVTADEPEQFFGDPAPEDAFGGEEGKRFAQIEAELVGGEEGERACAGPVVAEISVGQDGVDELEILMLGMGRINDFVGDDGAKEIVVVFANGY